MRTKITPPHSMTMISVIFSIVFACSCQRELLDPVSLVPVQESGFIRLRMENQSNDYDYPFLQTKVEISGSTGAASWTSGDEIAYCVTNGSSTSYVTAAVNIGSSDIELNMPEGYHRANYAIYPAASKGTNYTSPTVVYPTSYDMSGKNMETYSPMPMVALNTTNEMVFYHVGGLMRLNLLEVDANTKKITVTFNGISHVTGTYTVSNPGTKNASTTLSSGTGNTVTFNNVTVSGDNTWINVPLPTITLLSEFLVTIKTFNSSNTELQSNSQIVRWNSVIRCKARKYETNMKGPGVFGGLMIAPCNLMYNGTTFVIPFDDWNHDSYGSKYGKTNGSYYFRMRDVGQFFDSKGSSYSSGDIDNNGNKVSYNGFDDWRMPTANEIKILLATNTSSRPGSTVNGNNNKHFSVVSVSDVTHATVSPTVGFLIFPDNQNLTISGLTQYDPSRNFSLNTISKATLTKALKYRCSFIPFGGRYNSYWNLPSFDNGVYVTLFITATGTGDGLIRITKDYDWYLYSTDTSVYTPVRLVRDAE